MIPTGKRVLVEPIPVQEIHENSGIYLPEYAQEKQAEGHIRAIGEKVDRHLNLRRGDRIVFDRGYGIDVKIDGKDWFIVNQDNLLAVLE